MAIIKKNKTKNGIPIAYTMIKSITKVGDAVQVELNHYVDKTYRESEKAFEDISNRINDIVLMHAELMNRDMLAPREQERLDKLKNELYIYNSNLENGSAYAAATETITISGLDDISYDAIYEYLKTTDNYKNAKDD